MTLNSSESGIYSLETINKPKLDFKQTEEFLNKNWWDKLSIPDKIKLNNLFTLAFAEDGDAFQIIKTEKLDVR